MIIRDHLCDDDDDDEKHQSKCVAAIKFRVGTTIYLMKMSNIKSFVFGLFSCE